MLEVIISIRNHSLVTKKLMASHNPALLNTSNTVATIIQDNVALSNGIHKETTIIKDKIKTSVIVR